MTPYAESSTEILIGFPTLEVSLTYLIVAIVFGVVNTVIGNTIRVVAFPIYILTLGLIALLVNGLMLLIVNQVSLWLGFGLNVDGLSAGVLGALVLSITSWVIGLFSGRCSAVAARRTHRVKHLSRALSASWQVGRESPQHRHR